MSSRGTRRRLPTCSSPSRPLSCHLYPVGRLTPSMTAAVCALTYSLSTTSCARRWARPEDSKTFKSRTRSSSAATVRPSASWTVPPVTLPRGSAADSPRSRWDSAVSTVVRSTIPPRVGNCSKCNTPSGPASSPILQEVNPSAQPPRLGSMDQLSPRVSR